MAEADLPVRFRLSDMIAALFITGTTCLLLGLGETNPRDKDIVQILQLILVFMLECAASLWGCAILGTWKIDAFFKRVAVQTYAFISMASFLGLLATPFWLWSLIDRRFDPRWYRPDPSLLDVLLLLIFFTITLWIVSIMFRVERRRVKQMQNVSPRVPKKTAEI